MIRKINRKIIAIGMAFGVLALISAGSLFLARPSGAQPAKPGAASPAQPAVTTQIEYAAKFVCGIPGSEAQREAVKPGNYATAINIHNSNQLTTTAPINFTKHAILALPEGQNPIPPSRAVSESFPSDFAMEVDCQNIRDILGPIAPPPPAFIKGVLVLLTPPPAALDVIGVYSAEAPPKAPDGVPTGMGLEILPILPRTITH